METRVSDQPAFILRRREWRNSSLLLDLFSRDHGCLRVLAKGARRASAKASYQPFVMLRVDWSGRQELKTLTGIEGQALPVDETNYLALLYINELLLALMPAGEANAQVFGDYLTLLQQAATRLDEARVREFERVLLQQLGYLPDITAGAGGAGFRPNQYYRFVTDAGFVGSHAGEAGAVAGKVAMAWASADYEVEGVLSLARRVLRQTIDCNLHGKTLKSRDVFAQISRRK